MPVAVGATLIIAIVIFSLRTVRAPRESDAVAQQATAASAAADGATRDAAPPPVATPSPTPVAAQDPVVQQRESEREIIDAGEARLKARFEGEVVDPQWAASTSDALRTFAGARQIEQLAAKPQAFDISCRTTTCRIDARFRTVLQANDFFTLYPLVAGGTFSNSSMRTSQGPDGSLQVVFYLQAKH